MEYPALDLSGGNCIGTGLPDRLLEEDGSETGNLPDTSEWVNGFAGIRVK